MSSIEFTQQDGAIFGRVGGFAVNSVGGRCKGLNHSLIMEQTMLEDVGNLLTAEKSQHWLCYSLNVRLINWADTCQIWHLLNLAGVTAKIGHVRGKLLLPLNPRRTQ